MLVGTDPSHILTEILVGIFFIFELTAIKIRKVFLVPSFFFLFV